MTSPKGHNDPILPRELEYKIFREYFDSVDGNVDDICLVMRTAKRVHEWLLPLIEPHVRITILPRDRQHTQHNFKYPGIGDEGIFEVFPAIKHLYIGQPEKLPYDNSHLIDIIRLCHTNLEDIAVWDQRSNPTCLHNILPPDLPFPNLKRLSGMIYDIHLVHTQLQAKAGFGRVLLNVTHLDILIPYGELEKLPNLLKDCPDLTHLSIESEFLSCDMMERILGGCKQLTALVLWGPLPGNNGCDSLDPYKQKLASQIYAMRRSDHRIVMFGNLESPRYSIRTWKNGARGDEDVWAEAEWLIRARGEGRLSNIHFDPMREMGRNYVTDTVWALRERSRLRRTRWLA